MTTGGDSLTITIAGKDVGLEAVLKKVNAEMTKSADQAVKLGQSYARLAQAQGKPAASAQILSSTIGQAGAASEKALLGIETQAARVGASATYFEQFGSAAASSLTGMVGPAAAAGIAIAALKGSFDLAQASAKIDATRVSFDNLAASVNTTGDALLSKMRAAAQGTVSDANLIQSANSGLLLTQGRLAEDLPRILEISRAAAQATGDDVNFVFNSLVTGIARGSPKIIDNAKITLDASAAMETYAASIGKTVDQLNAADQQQATLNAVLAAGTDLIKAAGPAADSNAQSFARLAVVFENLKNTTGTALATGFAPYAKSIADASDATGSFIATIQGIPAALSPTAASAQASANALAAFDAEMARSGDTTQAEAAYQAVLASALQQSAGAAVAAAGAVSLHTDRVKDDIAATSASAAALVDETSKKLENAQAAQQLAQFQAALADLGGAVANGLNTAGSAAAALANQYHIAYGEALNLINAQAQLAQAKVNAAALAEQRSGERGPGASGVAEAANQEQARLNAIYKRLVVPEPKKAKGRKGGGGTPGVSQVKLTDQQKLNNSLLADQEKFDDKSVQAETDHLDRLLSINADFQDKMLKAQQAFGDAQVGGRASFYDSLGSIEDAGLRQALSAQYEAAFQEADKIAQERGADVGQKFLEAKQSAIEAQGKRQSEIAQATKDGDKDKAEYLAGVDKLYRQAEERKIAAAQSGADSVASERDKALADEGTKYADAQAKIGDSADQAAQRKILASERAGKQIDVEKLQVDGLKASYDALGASGSRAGITPGVAPVTTPTPQGAVPVIAASPGAAAPAADPIVAALDAIRAAVDAAANAIVGAEKDTGSAVRGLSGKFAS